MMAGTAWITTFPPYIQRRSRAPNRKRFLEMTLQLIAAPSVALLPLSAAGEEEEEAEEEIVHS